MIILNEPRLRAFRVEQGTDGTDCNKQGPKSTDNRRAGREIAIKGPEESTDAADCGDDPSNNESRPDAANEINNANRRNDQVAKYQEHSCYSDENGNDQPEAGVKGKIPPANTQTFLVGAVAIE